MSISIRKSVLSGLGFAAAAGSALLGAPVLAGPQAPIAAPITVAQGYGTPVEVVEVESVNGWYLTVGAGAIWPSSQGYRYRNTAAWQNFSNGAPAPRGSFDYNGGFSVDGGIGYDFGAIRTELTYGYSAPSLETARVSNYGGFTNSIGGKINKNDIFASVYWDVLPFSRFTPYIGGGIGYTNLSTPNVNLLGLNSGSTNEGLFGWQAKVGVSYALAFNWDVYVEGTYSGATGFDTNTVNYSSYNDYGAKLGFRYRFAQPAVVVVAPEPVRGLW